MKRLSACARAVSERSPPESSDNFWITEMDAPLSENTASHTEEEYIAYLFLTLTHDVTFTFTPRD